ncbi:phage tail tube protein [uncultured Megasphaera sp.]|uniref:phage tail tube protein n=1 Tax=uncultured Megasphaera sp. TaxID=165188 RepID=UPI00265B01EA|nr:phage tail tube protein [uncultured Megasphaera sp.]
MPEATINAIRTMFAGDVISAKLASAYVTIDNNRYLLFQAKSLSATIEKDKKEVAILGRLLKGNKSVSAKGSGTLRIYKNTSVFDDMVLNFVNNGVDTYFDMQISNEDPTSQAGRRTVILTGCNIDKTTVAAFDADGDWLEDEISFTFEGMQIPEKFAVLDGMQA